MRSLKNGFFISFLLLGLNAFSSQCPYISGFQTMSFCRLNTIQITATGVPQNATYAWAVNGQLLPYTGKTAFITPTGYDVYVTCHIYVAPSPLLPNGYLCSYAAWVSGTLHNCQLPPKRAFETALASTSVKDLLSDSATADLYNTTLQKGLSKIELVNNGTMEGSFLAATVDQNNVLNKFLLKLEPGQSEILDLEQKELVLLSDQPFSVFSEISEVESTDPKPGPSTLEK